MYGAEYHKLMLFGAEYQDVFTARTTVDVTSDGAASRAHANVNVSKASEKSSATFSRGGVEIEVSRRSRSRNRKTKKSDASKSRGVVCAFDEALEQLKKDREGLVMNFKESGYNEKTVRIQESVFDRFFVPVCNASGFDSEGPLTCEAINTVAAFLALVVPQSAATYLAHIKSRVNRVHRVLGAEKAEYSARLTDLRNRVAQFQEQPFLLEQWRKIDAVKGLSEELETCRNVMVVAWFIFSRPDELHDVVRVPIGDGASARFELPRSKVDQHGRGWSAVLGCCCAASRELGLKMKLCPVHAASAVEFKDIQVRSNYWMRSRFLKLLQAAGISNKKSESGRWCYNLYSIRIGGLQSAIVSGVDRQTALKIGRWRDAQTEQRYEAGASLCNVETKILKWPLISAKVIE